MRKLENSFSKIACIPKFWAEKCSYVDKFTLIDIVLVLFISRMLRLGARLHWRLHSQNDLTDPNPYLLLGSSGKCSEAWNIIYVRTWVQVADSQKYPKKDFIFCPRENNRAIGIKIENTFSVFFFLFKNFFFYLQNIYIFEGPLKLFCLSVRFCCCNVIYKVSTFCCCFLLIIITIRI